MDFASWPLFTGRLLNGLRLPSGAGRILVEKMDITEAEKLMTEEIVSARHIYCACRDNCIPNLETLSRGPVCVCDFGNNAYASASELLAPPQMANNGKSRPATGQLSPQV